MTGNIRSLVDGPDPVYRRTSTGQREAVFGQGRLDPALRKALLRVTGYTPRSRLGSDGAPYDELLSMGLIREVADPAPSFASLASRQAPHAPAA